MGLAVTPCLTPLLLRRSLSVGDIGMSLGVTGNALRLSRLKPERLFDS